MLEMYSDPIGPAWAACSVCAEPVSYFTTAAGVSVAAAHPSPVVVARMCSGTASAISYNPLGGSEVMPCGCPRGNSIGLWCDACEEAEAAFERRAEERDTKGE